MIAIFLSIKICIPSNKKCNLNLTSVRSSSNFSWAIVKKEDPNELFAAYKMVLLIQISDCTIFKKFLCCFFFTIAKLLHFCLHNNNHNKCKQIKILVQRCLKVRLHDRLWSAIESTRIPYMKKLKLFSKQDGAKAKRW